MSPARRPAAKLAVPAVLLAAVAHALAGLALGGLASLLTGRALAGAGVAFAACPVLHNLVDRFREDLWPTLTRRGAFEPPRRRAAARPRTSGPHVLPRGWGTCGPDMRSGRADARDPPPGVPHAMSL